MHRCPNRAHQDPFLYGVEGVHHHTRAQVILCVHRKDRPLPSIEDEEYQAQCDAGSEDPMIAGWLTGIGQAQADADWEAEGEDPMVAYERFLEDRYAYDS